MGQYADLRLEKTAFPNYLSPCNCITYMLKVTNAGPSIAKDTVLADSLPRGLCNPAYSCDGGCTWTPWPGFLRLGDVPSGYRFTVLVKCRTRYYVMGDVTNYAKVYSTTADPYPENNQAQATVNVRRPRCRN
jgi:uncharacterized repeat protein (TIGR01451 family)